MTYVQMCLWKCLKMASNFDLDLSKMFNSMLNLEDKVLMGLEDQADRVWTKLLENYAKENARWENRTGHARQRLKSDYILSESGIKLRLKHGVDYGKWLELAHEKKYSIIPETIEEVGESEIMPAFENFLEKIK